jgi:uncharacterized protein YbjQ (UPF0145 family)
MFVVTLDSLGVQYDMLGVVHSDAGAVQTGLDRVGEYASQMGGDGVIGVRIAPYVHSGHHPSGLNERFVVYGTAIKTKSNIVVG